MFKRSAVIALLTAAAWFVTTGALAGSNAPGVGKGFYLNGSAGGNFGGKVNKLISGINDIKYSDFVYNMGGGYQFNDYFGLEGGCLRFPDVKVAGSLAKDNSLINVAGKGIIPLNDGFNIFGKLGAARVGSQFAAGVLSDTSDNVSSFHGKILPYLGAGFGYSLTQHVDFSTQVAGTPKSDDLPPMYAVTGDIAYRF